MKSFSDVQSLGTLVPQSVFSFWEPWKCLLFVLAHTVLLLARLCSFTAVL